MYECKKPFRQPNRALVYSGAKAMIFSRDYVGYLARQTVKHLVDAK